MSEPSTSPPAAFPYAIYLNALYPALEKFALDSLVGAVRDAWYNQTLVCVNDAVLRLGMMQGEYHWHEHPADDECLFVLEGRS
jgi:hypothetical protein